MKQKPKVWETKKERETRLNRKLEEPFEKQYENETKTSMKKLKKGKRTHRKIVRMIRELKSKGVI